MTVETLSFQRTPCHSSEGWNPGNGLRYSPVSIVMKHYYVYLMASKKNGTLYIGVTSNLVKRVHQHRTEAVEGFTEKYKVHTLVYFETMTDVHVALKREKNIKAWQRSWKIRLIEEKNPNWKDLYPEITGCQPTLA